MPTYTIFDEKTGPAASFWKKNIAELNSAISKKRDDDAIGRSGITIVIGCPLPYEIQQGALDIRRKFTKALAAFGCSTAVQWRENLSALHITVFGVTKPADYIRQSWPLPNSLLDQLRYILSANLNFNITWKGLGVLGSGAVSARLSDCPEIEKIRREIMRIQAPHLSGASRGEKDNLNQIILGRFKPTLTFNERKAIEASLKKVRDIEVGALTVASFEMIHYKHEFLNHIYDQLLLP